MNWKKTVSLVLVSSLAAGTILVIPLAGQAKHSEKEKDTHAFTPGVDFGTINREAFISYLMKKGKIDRDASPEEIESAYTNYVSKYYEKESKKESASFVQKALASQQKWQQKASDRVANSDGDERSSHSFREEHVDNAVVALVEFPDLPHNTTKDGDYWFWTKDFSPQHYENMLFNPYGFVTKEGKKLTTMAQYYYEQSAGSWTVDGTVTKWIKAEKPAKYYGEAPPEGWDDYHVPDLVKETLATVGKKIKGHEDKYDQRDPYDLDGDGNVMEPDGLLDNLFLVHAGPGGDTGGGVLGPNDAIWPRRSWLDKPTSIPGTSLKALDYIIQPENGAIGVFSHEYGHNLGLPDEYDTTNVGADSPISRWSVMAAGSWAGKTPGTEPSGFSPWAKLFLRNVYGGKWPAASVINLDDVKGEKRVKIKEAVADSSQGKIVKINLPDVPRYPATEPIGKESYFSERGNDLDTKLTSDEIELPDGKQIALSFDSWRDIEIDYDFFYVNLYEGESKDPIRLIKFSDTTDKKWVQESIDLTPYAGKKVVLEFEYVTDTNTAMEGVFLDQIKVDVDGETLLEDDADGKDSYFTQNGFTTIDGTPTYYPNYYMLEWRTHNGVDVGLAHSVTRSGMFAYDPGLVIWYYDGRYGKENFVSQHPGHGFLGVVDAHQTNIVWNDGWVERSFYQIKDAAFNVKDTSPFRLVSVKNGAILEYNSEPGVKTFSDDLDYSNPFQPESGKILPVNGLSISIDKVNKYENEVYITISKK